MQEKTPKNNKSKSLEEKKRIRKQKLKELKDKEILRNLNYSSTNLSTNMGII